MLYGRYRVTMDDGHVITLSAYNARCAISKAKEYHPGSDVIDVEEIE